MSAKVAIQAGAPTGGHSGHSSHFFSSASSAADASASSSAGGGGAAAASSGGACSSCGFLSSSAMGSSLQWPQVSFDLSVQRNPPRWWAAGVGFHPQQ